MNEIQPHERHIYDKLDPVFRRKGYKRQAHKKQFILSTPNGFRCVQIALHRQEGQQLVDLRLGIRLNVIEELANQFLPAVQTSAETTTILTSYGNLGLEPQPKLLLESEDDLHLLCRRIEGFMHSKGFRFLEHMDHLRKLDKLLNRKPQKNCPFLTNQYNRCFKGIVAARITHRADFNLLVKHYLRFLEREWAPHEFIDRYKRLVRFMRFYSIN